MKENVESPGRNGELAANQPHLLSLPPWDRTLRPGTFIRWKQQLMFFIVLQLCISVSHRITSARDLPLKSFPTKFIVQSEQNWPCRSRLFRCSDALIQQRLQPHNFDPFVKWSVWIYLLASYLHIEYRMGGICLEVLPWGREDRSVGAA